MLCYEANATHVRAGEIQATKISCPSNRYLITIIMYVDTEGVEPGLGRIDFGDGTFEDLDLRGQQPDERELLGDNIEKVIYYRDHTFPGPSTYVISFREENRNDGIVNIDGSVNNAFYVETVIRIDPSFGCDNSPILLNPPIDKGCIGVAFLHNAGAVDIDGDSLSYEFTIPKQSRTEEVTNYRFPNVHDINAYGAQNEQQNGPATFTIDEVTGDIVWDAPGGEGEYNFAFKVIQWKKIGGIYRNMGYVIRDMQVLISDCDNERPELILPPDTCVVAGNLLEAEIMAEDPDGDSVEISSFGVVYEFPTNPATFTPDPPVYQSSPASGDFAWQTTCNRISSLPYFVHFKAIDTLNGIQLADYDTWQIRVVGPPPEGLLAEQGFENSVGLSWDNYQCDNAETIKIYRRVDSYDYMPENCELGIPENADYELIGEVGANSTSFTDNDPDLLYGVKYCYRIVATFNVPDYMESVVSEETCVLLEEEIDALMTNVSIEVNDDNSGEIFVRWTSPFGTDTTTNPRPYTYDLYRGNGFDTPGTLLLGGGMLSDTTFTDEGLNTLDNVYNYFVITYDANGVIIDTSAVASSVRLEASALKGAIEISWSANTPWSNFAQNFPMHLVYRDNVIDGDPDQLVLIDSTNVFVDGQIYLDDGSATGEGILDDKIEYCYYITTRGTYGNEKIMAPLENNSQLICAQPNDSIPPCTPPELVVVNSHLEGSCEDIQQELCDFNDYENILSWTYEVNDTCGFDVSGFNVYFSEDGSESGYEIIAFVRDTSFVHDDISSYKGCYRISAVDRSGNESELTEPMCNDNCPIYVLPNIFTPNGDSRNDVFQAFGEYPYDSESPYQYCPRFVESVLFEVYNRWGELIFDYESGGENSIFIEWDGIGNNGSLVANGTYYYVATVTFDMLDPKQRVKEFKGWIKIDKGS